jgi:hypothetical protein
MPTLPTPKLDLLWPALLSARQSLQQTLEETLAAPFWSAADESYRSFKLRFMLVGRATRGPYDAEEFLSQLGESQADALMGRKELNRRLVEKIRKPRFGVHLLRGASIAERRRRLRMQCGRT